MSAHRPFAGALPYGVRDLFLAEAAQLAAVESIWQQLVRAYLKLSPYGEWIVAPESGHYIHLDQPDLVIREVQSLVESVRQARTGQSQTPA